jgi:hypothetical protein
MFSHTTYTGTNKHSGVLTFTVYTQFDKLTSADLCKYTTTPVTTVYH